MDPSKKEPGMTAEQETIDRVIDELDVDIAILITADAKTGVSMCAAAHETSGSAISSQWMAKISYIVFGKKALSDIKPANKIPV